MLTRLSIAQFVMLINRVILIYKNELYLLMTNIALIFYKKIQIKYLHLIKICLVILNSSKMQ